MIHALTPQVLAVTGLYHAAGGAFTVNAGIILTSTTIVWIDAGMTTASAEFLVKTAHSRKTGQDKALLVLTHHHSDHVFGMRILKEHGATVLAHHEVEPFLEGDTGNYKAFIAKQYELTSQEADEILGDVQLSVPDVLIREDTALGNGDDEIQILVTPGHVRSELAVFHPASGTLFAGDVVYADGPPTTRFGGPTEWREWIRHLRRLQRLDIRHVIPGHGPISHKAVLEENARQIEGVIAAG